MINKSAYIYAGEGCSIVNLNPRSTGDDNEFSLLDVITDDQK